MSVLDATGSKTIVRWSEAQNAYPKVAFSWTVDAAGITFANDAESVLCPAETSLTETETLLSALPKLTTIDLLNTKLMFENVEALMGQYPNVQFHVNKSSSESKVDYWRGSDARMNGRAG